LGWSEPLRELVRRVQEFPAPVIALVEGGVWGGACELVFACDIILTTPEASFALTPARLGVPYNVTGLKNLAAVMPLVLLKEMVFTARPVSAERAWQVGAINHMVPADKISERTAELARTVAENAPLTIAAMKEALLILQDAHTLSPIQYERLQHLRGQVGTSADYREGLAAFAAKRAPVFRGQ
jgi:methylmalonyl-CoA decarboxylase